MKITYLGQEGFLIEHNNTRILTDPYLSDYVDRNSAIKDFEWIRAYAPPTDVKGLGKIDAVFLTHEHDDHTDPETIPQIVREKENALFMISESKAEFLESLGVQKSRIKGACCYECYRFNDIEVVPIPAAHEELHLNTKYQSNVYDELGYIFNTDEISVFHAGDTYDYEGLDKAILNFKGDRTLIMLLPVNGADEERRSKGIAGNMNCREAFELAKRCNAAFVIPMHHDLYPKNGVSNDEILQSAQECEISGRLKLPKPGESFEFSV